MASITPVFQHSQYSILFTNKTRFQTSPYHQHSLISIPGLGTASVGFRYSRHVPPIRATINDDSFTTAVDQEKNKKNHMGFVDELRSNVLRLHTKEQVKEGQKEVKAPHERHVSTWEPTFDGYVRFLVDSKLVYDTLEGVIDNPTFPYCEFRNTGLERSEKLAKDLEWFKDQGHVLPEPSDLGVTYAHHLKELSDKDSKAILCHFYNIHFGLTAGGRMMGKKVSEKLLNKKELEFYKWDGDVSQLLQNVRDKLNKVAESWTTEEKNQCLVEAEKSFKYYGDIIGLILS